jgi:hypothetical protein
MARSDVALAHRLARGNAQITARLAKSLTGAEAAAADRKRADDLARTALRADATVVAAVTILGINAEVRGDRAAARRLFAYNERLSRRDLATQLWAIEDAVARGDVAGALRHYDIALRTSPESAELLFPVLTSASADAAVRTGLIRLLATKPFWADPFISYVAEKGPDPNVIATLLTDLRHAGVQVPATARAAAVTILTRGGYVDAAWRYYALDRKGADRRRSRDPEFTADIDAPTPLDWTAVETPGISTAIQRGVFEFSAPSSIGGPLLRQLQLLPAGVYRLSGHGTGIDQPANERPYWLLTCHDGREFGRIELPASAQSNGSFVGTMAVPAGCGIQMLQLLARPVSAATGLSGQIDRVQLEPMR